MRSSLFLSIIGTASAVSIHQVYDFTNKSWLENLAIRSNGNVLATSFYTPVVYQFDPSATNVTANPVHTFDAAGVSAITELKSKEDVFAIACGTFLGIPHDYAVYTIDFRGSTPDVKQIASLPDTQLPNGMASLDAEEDAILISDSWLGVIWRLELSTGDSSIAINDTLMHPANARDKTSLGVNGIRIHNEYLYFINSDGTPSDDRAFLARVPIYANGSASGSTEVVGYATGGYRFDDFAIDDDGTAYVATGTGNAVTKIMADGNVEIVAGRVDSPEIANPTSVQFGRGLADKSTLYVTTAGGEEAPINNITYGAQLVAVDLLGRWSATAGPVQIS